MTDRYLNKQTILNRMRRFAADYYGVNWADLLDPVVDLFLESVGEEIYRIAGDINDMEQRILDKLSSMLVSDMELLTLPMRGILHASASSAETMLTTGTAFRCGHNPDKPAAGLSFYPVCNTKIYNGDIRYFIYDGQFYSLDKESNKTLLTRSRQRESFSENSFWIGVELDEKINDIGNMSFYIDFSGIYNKEQYLKQISSFLWETASVRILMQRGMSTCPATKGEDRAMELYDALDASNKINNFVKKEYDPYFLSVKGSFDISNFRELFPSKLADLFPDTFRDDFTTPLLWIEITCPVSYTSDIIDSLQISLNAFPAVCKKLVSKTVEISREVSVIPLYTAGNESFLSVRSLSDSTGKIYYDIPVNKNDTNQYGIYSLRQGGCERYSIRDGKEYLGYAADSLDSEVSALFQSSKESKNDVKKIQADLYAVVRNLRQVIEKETERFETENYILVEPETDNEIYFVKYWVADFVCGHKLRAGTPFQAKMEPEVNPTSVFLLTAAAEGRYAPRQYGRPDIFRKLLTKHPLLITDEDIVSFCKKEFLGLVRDVSVSRGFCERDDKKTGFIRTTDVYIRPEKDVEKTIGEEDFAYIKQTLAKNSPVTFNYRIFIKPEYNQPVWN